MGTLSRKNYIAIAEVISALRPLEDDPNYVLFSAVVGGIGRYLEEDNPRFDRYKFVSACYARIPNPGKKPGDGIDA